MQKLESGRFSLSALIVPVLSLHDCIQACREEHTRSGADGLIPHITVLYPFVASEAEYVGDRARLRELCATIEPFSVVLEGTGRFPEGGVLYIRPEPVAGLLSVTMQFVNAFPHMHPYEGKIPVEKLKPHVTVAVNNDGKELDRIEDELKMRALCELPLALEITEIWLAVRSGGTWYERDRFRLGT